MRRNPKYEPDDNVTMEMVDFAGSRKADHLPPALTELAIEWNKGRRTFAFGGRGKRLGMVNPRTKQIVLYELDLTHPTAVHFVYRLLERLPELLDYRIVYHERTWGSGEMVVEDAGIDGREFMRDVRVVREPSVIRHGHDRSKDELTEFEYLALVTPQEMTWYHATLSKNEESIFKHGLLPGGETRASGWSPSWNMGLQDAVYLTDNEAYARSIAETISVRSDEPASVLVVAGSGLTDTRLLTLDEDALRDEYSDTPNWSNYDQDFPQWVSSLESRVASVAYMGVISPSAISVLARCTTKTIALIRPYAPHGATPETHPDSFEYESETSWSDGWTDRNDDR